ncbi:MAG: thioredoxin domain-containing protein [Methanohalophilus sp.]
MNSNTNRLARENSPYLRQHSTNPVDWYPWSEEAFEQARKKNLPVFLSIGYSTCHWCHVMAEESFEDVHIANLLNSNFIPVKVDREERPDVDEFYMEVCQAMNGSGGWPLTIIMTPEKKPFFAATYMPKEAAMGKMGLSGLLMQVTNIWDNKRDEIRQQASHLVSEINNVPSGKEQVTLSILEDAFSALFGMFDWRNGGFGPAPKFPSPSILIFLLNWWKTDKRSQTLTMIENTLSSMANGGIFDHLGGGFHRYSTDARWNIPHFEKMLYDQAMLVIVYLLAYQATGNVHYRSVADSTISYMGTVLRHPEGGFYCGENADSEGKEGLFYLWSRGEIEDSIGKKDSDFFLQFYDLIPIDVEGSENGGVLRRNEYAISDTSDAKLKEIRSHLLSLRSERVRPSLDNKILTDWNGLAIAALSMASRICGDASSLKKAKEAASFILSYMRRDDGKLYHRFHEGNCGIDGFLDDYAFLALGLIELYEATFETKYLKTAIELVDIMVDVFYDEEQGGFFFSASDVSDIPHRTKKVFDGPYPSGNSMAVYNLFWLFHITGNLGYRELAQETLSAFGGMLKRSPPAYSYMLTGFMLGEATIVVIVTDSEQIGLKEMMDVVRKNYLPQTIFLLKNPGSARDLARIAPYTLDMNVKEGRTTAYVCKGQSCTPPVNDSRELESLLF